MILQLVVSIMILMCFLLGIVAAIAPWIGIIGAVRYFRQRKSECRQVTTYSEQEYQMAYRPTGPKMDGKDWLILLGTLAYLISPLDVLPDIFIGLGWCDDLGLLVFAVKHFYSKFWSNKEPETPPEAPSEPPRRAVITRHEDEDAIDAEFEVRNLPALRQNQLVRRR